MIFQVKDPGKTRAGKFRLEPGTVLALILKQELHSALDDGMFRGPAVAAETLDDARGDVGRRGIDHSIVVSKRNVAKEFAIIVAVEGAPATIAILHAEQPLNATAHGGFHPSGLGILHALESHQ